MYIQCMYQWLDKEGNKRATPSLVFANKRNFFQKKKLLTHYNYIIVCVCRRISLIEATITFNAFFNCILTIKVSGDHASNVFLIVLIVFIQSYF